MKLLIALLLAVSFSRAHAEGADDTPASITWVLYTVEGFDAAQDGILPARIKIDGETLTVGFEYYWNGEKVGRDLDGLAGLYERIKRFKGDSIVLHIRSPDPKPKGMGWRMNPSIMNHLDEYENLLREKGVSFTIECSRHPMGVCTGYGTTENPFLRMKEHQNKK